ncbi:MAG: hypothetical protein IKX00_02275 [Bacilli bacterium]|nr:hypothetical protein [Bacilli bacterium]
MKKLLKFIIFILLIILFIYFGTKEYKSNYKKDVEGKNASSTLLSGDYVFVGLNHSKVLNKLSTKNSSIIYACIDGNKLCVKYGFLIDEVAKSYGIDTVYYYDIKEDRQNNNGTYQKIVNKLKSYAITDDTGKQNLYAPTLIFIKNGDIYAFDDSLSIVHGNKDIDELWNEELVNAKKAYLTEVMEGYISNE